MAAEGTGHGQDVRANFEKFLESQGLANAIPQERDKLFRKFLEWQASRR